jgi:hypothetical protein
MMTQEQIGLIRLLAEVRVYHRHDRDRIDRFVSKLTDAEPLALDAWDDRTLRGLVHKFRRQHRQCACLKCLSENMKHDNPYQGTLLGEGMQ